MVFPAASRDASSDDTTSYGLLTISAASPFFGRYPLNALIIAIWEYYSYKFNTKKRFIIKHIETGLKPVSILFSNQHRLLSVYLECFVSFGEEIHDLPGGRQPCIDIGFFGLGPHFLGRCIIPCTIFRFYLFLAVRCNIGHIAKIF